MTNLMESLHIDQFIGSKESRSLDLINRPRKADRCITPNRGKIFKKYNYSFSKN